MRHMTLVTGATGFVGRELVRELAANGNWLLLLIRGDTFSDAVLKYKRLMATLSPMESARCMLCHGDVTQRGVILGDEAYRLKMKQLMQQWVVRTVHCAASVSFDNSTDTHTSNYTGTLNVLELTTSVGIKSIHYVSTAYVNGFSPGTQISENVYTDHRTITFRNNYEESKHKAEWAVKVWPGFEKGRISTVYRPAIIVGDSMTGRTACYQGFYALLRCAQFMKRALDEGRLGDIKSLKIPLNGDEPVNLVPVDYVVDFIATVIDDERKEGKIYHLVPKNPFTVKEVVDVISQYFKFDGIELVGQQDRTEINEIGILLSEYLGPYFKYFGTDSYYQTDNADTVMSWQPGDAKSQLMLWIDYAVQNKFGRKKK